MKQILVIVDTENLTPHESGEVLERFGNNLDQTTEDLKSKYERLNAGAYLINSENTLNVLRHVLVSATSQHVHLKVLFFDENVAWSDYKNS